jgi:hypothetical protein
MCFGMQEGDHDTRGHRVYSHSVVSLHFMEGISSQCASVASSPILVTPMMMEALSSSETSVLATTTRCNIPEDGILHGHRRENPKSYIALIG